MYFYCIVVNQLTNSTLTFPVRIELDTRASRKACGSSSSSRTRRRTACGLSCSLASYRLPLCYRSGSNGQTSYSHSIAGVNASTSACFLNSAGLPNPASVCFRKWSLTPASVQYNVLGKYMYSYNVQVFVRVYTSIVQV